MKLFSALLLSAALIVSLPVFAKDTQSPYKNTHEFQARTHQSRDIKVMKNGSYKVVTWEGNKKITTVYKPIGSRKVGLVGNRPYPISSRKGLDFGGEYYTQAGVKYFRASKDLKVEYTGSTND